MEKSSQNQTVPTLSSLRKTLAKLQKWGKEIKEQCKGKAVSFPSH